MVMFLTTLVTSTVQYFKDKGDKKSRKERRHGIIHDLFRKKTTRASRIADKQKDVLNFHFPSFERMKYLTVSFRTASGKGHLKVLIFSNSDLELGPFLQAMKSVSSGDMANREIDELLEQSQLMEKVYREVQHVPIIADFSEGAIGFIGKESVVKKEIHQIIGQLAFFHSYHDLRLVFIFNEEEYRHGNGLNGCLIFNCHIRMRKD